MEYVELSSKNVVEKTKELYEIIKKDYKYDLVIFVAKGSYTIGKELSELGGCPLLEIKAMRSGNKIKKVISPLLKLIPKKIKIALRRNEFNSNVHEKNKERNIIYNDTIWSKYKKCHKILLVDDSIDTGYTIKQCSDEIKKYFLNSEVRIAALNYFDKSKKIIDTNYFVYKDTMLNGPWSNDSKYYKEFIHEYQQFKKRGKTL